MLTRCPNCETTFRVTPEQLKARHGKVRCGECQAVFDALDTLVEDAPAAVMPPAAEAPAQVPPANADAPVMAEEAPTIEATAANIAPEAAEAPAEASIPVAATPEPVIDAETSSGPAAPESESEAAAPGAPAVETSAPDDEWLAAAEPPKPRRRWPWVLGGAAALLALGFQAVMHFRTEIAVLHPDMKPALAGACEFFGCELRLPRKAELMSIETSDLHPEADGRLSLTATLKNRAPFAQEHPHLELSLTDTADKALVRRVLAPTEYAAAAGLSAGLAAGAELPVDLAIDAPGVPAAGYRLYLFYP